MLSNQKISSICSEMLNKAEELLQHFGIEYVEFQNRFAFPCPVHGGDSSEACCIFTDGTTSKGNWQCFTRGCQEEYIDNLFGFVRGCLSYDSGNKVSMSETADFCLKFLNKDIDELSVVPKKKLKTIDVFNRNIERTEGSILRSDIRNRLSIPAAYYLNRDYSELVLEAFDVGECTTKNQPMSGRVVVPVYDEEYNYVGCVGRAIKEHLKPKWLHSHGFKKNVLYGLNLAKEEIMNTATVILVEGQGDVWRLFEAGITNTVGIFGCSLNEDQLILLERSGAMNVVILTDYDDAGKKAASQIVKICGRRFNYIRPEMISGVKDVGDLTVQQIKQFLYPQLKGFINEN